MINKWLGLNAPFENPNEQNLVESLIIQSIQARGRDLVYLPQTLTNVNTILGESSVRTYSVAYIIEGYLENVMGFDGEKNMLSKFGIQIQKTASIIMSMKRFNEEVQKGPYNLEPNQIIDQQVRPFEGDLIYLPLTKDIFEITFVDDENVFYQLGKKYVWKITIEKMKYSNEVFQTGLPEIDSIATRYQNNDSIVDNPIADNTNFHTEIDPDLDTTEPDPFSLSDY